MFLLLFHRAASHATARFLIVPQPTQKVNEFRRKSATFPAFSVFPLRNLSWKLKRFSDGLSTFYKMQLTVK